MSWETNRDKGKSRDPYKRKNVLRRLREQILEEEPISNFMWDVEDEKETTRASKAGGKEAMD